MNPKFPEVEYYNRIINCYSRVHKVEDFKKFETFACREIASIFHEGKNPTISPTEKKLLDIIALNTVLLMLSLFRPSYEMPNEPPKHSNDQTPDNVKKMFFSVV